MFDAAVRAEAAGLLTTFSRFKTILTLTLFENIFEILGPLNKYLQGNGTDLSAALAAVDIATEKLQKLRDTNGAAVFALAEERAENHELATSLPNRRVSRPKRRYADEAPDERADDPKKLWLNETFYPALDAALSKINEKFQSQREILKSLNVFLPSSFRRIKSGIDDHVHDAESTDEADEDHDVESIDKADDDHDAESMMDKTDADADDIVKSKNNESESGIDDEHDSESMYKADEDDIVQSKKDKRDTESINVKSWNKKFIKREMMPYILSLEMDTDLVADQMQSLAQLAIKHESDLCIKPERNTFFNVYRYILDNNLDVIYPELSTVYKILSTIPTSSAECERAFSKMKLIKDRLASNMTHEHLSDRLLLAHEHELMYSLDIEDIIREYADTDELKAALYP